jgi:DNA polymerase alpha subunit A
MSVRPSRRRGRLSEKEEAAATNLRELREGGGLRIDEHELEDEADVYEEVDQKEFESREAGERQSARDFIEDDEGIGYLDENEQDPDEEEVDGKRSKGKRQKTAASSLPQSTTLASFFKKGPVKTKSASEKAAASNVKVNEDDLMNSLLGADTGSRPTAAAAARPKAKSAGISRSAVSFSRVSFARKRGTNLGEPLADPPGVFSRATCFRRSVRGPQ